MSGTWDGALDRMLVSVNVRVCVVGVLVCWCERVGVRAFIIAL